MVRNAVTTFGSADDGAAGFHDLRRSGHSLDGLIEVLIQRVAGVRRHDDIEWLIYASHGILTSQLARCCMFLKKFTGKSGSNQLVAIERDVEGKVHAGHAGDLPYI